MNGEVWKGMKLRQGGGGVKWEQLKWGCLWALVLAIIFFSWVEPFDIFYFYIILQGSRPLHEGRQLILNGH
ncbi:hypothetical protein ES332_A05G147000v1 [Gossypium tomentosum]|uniref:Uncharacterized protein n=1 Tax=Gossypium tomentosum TaxID=34277 RepID=A0A5D2QID9_GOSTO|nr:hypothetical protein ES332_A05G147000v1 [Gossypium tomentosum]